MRKGLNIAAIVFAVVGVCGLFMGYGSASVLALVIAGVLWFAWSKTTLSQVEQQEKFRRMR